MARTIFYIENIDNTGTLYEDVISLLYPEELWNLMLTNTKFLRNSILKLMKDFIESEEVIYIKEFSDSPPMIYDDPEKFDFGMKEIATDFIIVKDAFGLSIVNDANDNIDEKYALVLEALNTEVITKHHWDEYLDDLYMYYSGEGILHPRVQKIIIEDGVQVLEHWMDEENIVLYEMLLEYLNDHNIDYNDDNYWKIPLDRIAETYWEKFSFVLTINDYDLYDETKAPLLDYIAENLYNNGYYDEIVIKMNYLYWNDDFQKIVDWTEQNLKSALVSYRFDTLFSNDTKNRYFDDEEATFFGDIQRRNTVDEEIQMFEERLPIFRDKILTNPQTYGFELKGGYFGQEGNIPNLTVSYEDFEQYKHILCKSLAISPFARLHDNFKIVFHNPRKQVFFCVKGDD